MYGVNAMPSFCISKYFATDRNLAKTRQMKQKGQWQMSSQKQP